MTEKEEDIMRIHIINVNNDQIINYNECNDRKYEYIGDNQINSLKMFIWKIKQFKKVHILFTYKKLTILSNECKKCEKCGNEIPTSGYNMSDIKYLIKILKDENIEYIIRERSY